MRRHSPTSRFFLAVRGLLLLALLFATSCGAPSGLVVVRVNGLVKEITALYVTIKLDGVDAKNSQPQSGLGDMTFVVYDEMQRFGVQVPSGTQSLSLNVIGYNTNLVALRTGSATLELTQGSEVEVTLQ